MDQFVHHFLIGAAGAAAFESLKLWELHGKLTEKRFRQLVRSLCLWVPLILMLASSGFIAWAFYEGEEAVKAWNLAVVGIASRTLVRDVVSAGLANRKIKLGGEASSAQGGASLRDYFS